MTIHDATTLPDRRWYFAYSADHDDIAGDYQHRYGRTPTEAWRVGLTVYVAVEEEEE